MDDKEKKELADISKVTGGVLGNVVLALVLSWLLIPLINWASKTFYGSMVSPEMLAMIDMGLFLGIILADPIGHFAEKKQWRRMVPKLLFGGLAGIGINYAINVGIVQAGENKSLFFLPMLIPLLVFPVMMGSFAVKRFSNDKSSPLSTRLRGAAIEYLDTAGPTLLLLTHGVAMAFYWLLQPSVSMTLAIIAVFLFGIIGYCAIATTVSSAIG